jgi:hypothetical protein
MNFDCIGFVPDLTEGDSPRLQLSPFSRKQPLTPTLSPQSGAREQTEPTAPTQLDFVTP